MAINDIKNIPDIDFISTVTYPPQGSISARDLDNTIEPILGLCS